MKLYYLTAFLAVITFPPPILSSNGGWSDPSKAQYHIQTDEGPERYFRYQTLSGQYRKEKRLEDGTVIGTYGWVDDDGFLRMRDYIADTGGYRILKTKNVFVGRNRPVNEALSIAKKVPGEAGTLVSPGVSPVSKTASTPYYSSSSYSQPSTKFSTPTIPQNTYTYSSPANVQVLPVGYSAEHLQTPVFKYATLTLPQTTNSLGYSTPTPPQSTYLGYTPTVEVSPNSIPSSTASPISVTTAVPSSTILPPELPSSTPAPHPSSTTPTTVYIPSTTPSSISSSASSNSIPAYQTSTARYDSLPSKYTVPSTNYGSPMSSSFKYVSPTPGYTQSNNYVAAPTSSTLAPPIGSNALDPSLYSGSPQYEHYPEDEKAFVNPYIFQNGPTYPIDRRGHTYNGQSNNIGNGYDPQFPLYDGISVTNDGFRYYIPKQYHEEQNLPGNIKSGSFGYVDPFGIRRVIYYNAGPDGFKHRKNNRYVGLNATPYDPRPY